MAPTARAVRAAAVWTPEGARRDATVVVAADGRIREVRAARAGDPEVLPGLLVPGLVNAHTHLELSALGPVPGGEGLVPWVEEVMERAGRGERRPADGARRAAALGTAVVCDVANTVDTGDFIAAAGMAGVVQAEWVGLDRARVEQALRTMAASGYERQGAAGPVRRRPTAHALYSTDPAILDAAVAYAGPGAASPPSVHVAESAAEDALLSAGIGPLADLLARRGLPWHAPGCSPVAFLDRRGWLGRLLVVHAVHTEAADRARLAATGTPVCLCPRSNRHIEGALPDVEAFIEAGVPLCLGTDSLASSPDLDVLGEIPVLHDAFPEVPVGLWLDAATRGGAAALGFPAHGAIAPGMRPGLLLLDAGDVEDLGRAAPARRWVVHPDGRA